MKPILFLHLAILAFSSLVWIQETATESSQDAGDPRIEALEKQLQETITEFREIVRDAQRNGFEYVNALTVDQASELIDGFYEKIKVGNEVRERIIPLVEELVPLKVAGADGADDELVHLATGVMEFLYRRGEYSRTYRLAKDLVANNSENEYARVYLARSGVLTNDFSPAAAKTFEKNAKFFEENDSVTDTEKLLFSNLERINILFAKELEIRELEKQADDLPRVKFMTTQGEFVIELFENEAPQTVANFISLVESGFYDDLYFHTVIQQTAAETGVAAGAGVFRDVGYTIYDEYDKPDARLHFSGSVSMVSEEPNSGAARFFVSLAPLPNFNGKRTVFGRILTGMDTVYRINHTYRIEEGEQIQIENFTPDKVKSAQVLRKRDHEYLPTKVTK